MISKNQSTQLKSSTDYDLHSSTLLEIAALLTSCSDLKYLFTDLHSLLKKVIPFQQFKLGLFNTSQEYIEWIFTAENNHEQFEITKSLCKPFWNEALSNKQSMARSMSSGSGLIEICSPIRLYSQNLGIIRFEILDNVDIPKYFEFIDLVAFFLAFLFTDLKIEDDKLVRQLFFREELKDTKQLNEKLLSIIGVARSLAHELNQPLTGISGYAALIVEAVNDGNSESIMSDLENILEQASRLESLIFKFQSIAHIEGREDKVIL